MIKIDALVNRDLYIKEEFKKYCEDNFKIKLYSLNFFLNNPYIENSIDIPTINNLNAHYSIECINSKSRPEGIRKGEEIKKLVEEIKSGKIIDNLFKNYIKDKDYFFKRNEKEELVDILMSFEFLLRFRIFYFEC